MIKCYFVDVKSITCNVPRSNFAEAELEQLADFILETDGLIRPLILSEIGIENYTVIEGYREYYGAVIAKEKNSKKAEMVNAFVVNSKVQPAAIAQINLLDKDKNIKSPAIPVESKEPEVERLLPIFASIMSQQLQPLTQELARVTAQLTEHQKMLELLAKNGVATDNKILAENLESPEVIKLKEKEQPVIIPEIIKPPAEVSSQVREIKPSVEAVAVITPLKPNKSTGKKKNSSKVKSDVISEKVAPVGAEIALDLINRLSHTDLSLNMQQVRIPNAVKLATGIIAARNQQPEKKFDRWETFISSVKGLGAKTAQLIIDNLR